MLLPMLASNLFSSNVYGSLSNSFDKVELFIISGGSYHLLFGVVLATSFVCLLHSKDISVATHSTINSTYSSNKASEIFVQLLVFLY